MIYNLVITEYKTHTSFPNLSKEEFFKKLWEWTYEDDLWDYFIDEPEILEEEHQEDLEDWLWDFFIPECVFHNDEDDTVNCYAFVVKSSINGSIMVEDYYFNQDLVNFILKKIEQKYDKKLVN